MPAYRRPLASLLAAAGLFAAPALAAPAPPYADLLKSAATAPAVTQGAAEVDAAQGRLRQAGAWRNPQLSLETENFSGRGAYEGFDAAETTFSLSQTFELGGKRQARISAARQDLAAANARDALGLADYAARLAVAYAEAEAATARLADAQELKAAAEADARVARLMVEAGKEAALRGVQAQAEADAATADHEQALAQRDTAFARLTALAGSQVPFDSLAESLLSRPVVMPAEAENPAIAAAQTARDLAAARVGVERSHAAPDVTLSAGMRRLAGDDATAFVAGVSVPLPLFDRNRGGADAARAELRAADARLQQARFDADADRLAIRAQARSAAARVGAAQAGEAAAAEAYRLARLGYEAGRIPLLELTAARRALAQARSRAVDARLDQVRAQADAARAAGRIPFGA